MAETISFRVCIDCAMLHANGETPVEMSETETAAWLIDVSNALAGLGPVAIGDPDGFSWSSCEGCNSRLGGDRFEAFAELLEDEVSAR
jgi:hypothetical protein